jgi:hypothetical protein
MLIKDSTLQQLLFFPVPAEQLVFFMAFPPSGYLTKVPFLRLLL